MEEKMKILDEKEAEHVETLDRAKKTRALRDKTIALRNETIPEAERYDM